jgi:hypothetical protein
MELKFGCIVTNGVNEWVICDKDLFAAPYVNGQPHVAGRWGYKGSLDGIKPNVKILGRPIRLADVLLTMSQKAITSHAIALNGGFYQLKPEEHWVTDWNLEDDNLDHQSNECKQFLTDLLLDEKKARPLNEAELT